MYLFLVTVQIVKFVTNLLGGYAYCRLFEDKLCGNVDEYFTRVYY